MVMRNQVNLTANGQSASFVPESAPHWGSVFAASGDLGGGTATLQVSVDDGSTWETVAGSQLDAATKQVRVFLQGSYILRYDLTGATGPNVDVGFL